MQAGTVINLSRTNVKNPLPNRSQGSEDLRQREVSCAAMDGNLDAISRWVAREIVPHEATVRRWLGPRCADSIAPEDIIQDAYCKLSGLSSVDHINNPQAYFFQAARTALMDRYRRAKKIDFTSMAQIEWSDVIDSEPSQDRVINARQELAWATRLIANLSTVQRRAVELRRIDGLSRKEAAKTLGITEDALKKHVERGLKGVMEAMTTDALDGSSRQSVETRRKAE